MPRRSATAGDSSAWNPLDAEEDDPERMHAWMMHPDNRQSSSHIHIGMCVAEAGHDASLDVWLKQGGRGHERIAGVTIGHAAARLAQDDCLRVWIRYGGDLHAIDDTGASIGDAALIVPGWGIHHDPGIPYPSERLDTLATWIRAGGCIWRGDPARRSEMMDAVLGIDDDHPAIVITQSSVSLVRSQTVGNGFREALSTPSGTTMASSILESLCDPIDLARWIQAMDRHASV
jgi:hypothetical protein